MRALWIFGLAIVMSWLAAGCASAPPPAAPTPEGATNDMATFQLTSTAFSHGNPIPARYTCSGDDISPPLAWTSPPVGTQSLALIMDDPDAPVGTWVHWVLFNLPPTATHLPEAAPPPGSVQGNNSWGRVGYGGPCPPGGTHRYFFKLFALDTTLDLPAGATKAQVKSTIEGHVLSLTELMGTYAK